MVKSSCVSHPSEQMIAILRQDYLEICRGAGKGRRAYCAAMLLNMFEHWQNAKFRAIEDFKRQPEEDSYKAKYQPTKWIYFTEIAMAQEQLLGMFGVSMVSECIDWLVEQEFILTRRNPKKGYDRTKQFALSLDNIHTELQTVTEKQRMHSLNLTNGIVESNETIPKVSSKESLKDSLGSENPEPRPAPKSLSSIKDQIAAIEAKSVEQIHESQNDAHFPPEDNPLISNSKQSGDPGRFALGEGGFSIDNKTGKRTYFDCDNCSIDPCNPSELCPVQQSGETDKSSAAPFDETGRCNHCSGSGYEPESMESHNTDDYVKCPVCNGYGGEGQKNWRRITDDVKCIENGCDKRALWNHPQVAPMCEQHYQEFIEYEHNQVPPPGEWTEITSGHENSCSDHECIRVADHERVNGDHMEYLCGVCYRQLTEGVKVSRAREKDAKPKRERSPKQLANDTKVKMLGEAWGVEAQGGDYAAYLKIAQTLNQAGIASRQFRDYVEHWRPIFKAKNWEYTLHSLTAKCRPSEYMGRDKQPVEATVYDPTEDEAYQTNDD